MEYSFLPHKTTLDNTLTFKRINHKIQEKLKG